MAFTSLFAPNISNYHNLALFICHLFIDGHFHTGHILYDPNVFCDSLIGEIDTICPQSIPWINTDVTTQDDILLTWNPMNRTDRFLQLIFIDSNNLPENIDSLKHLLTFYNLYVIQLTETNSTETNTHNSTNSKLKEYVDYRSPILNYSLENEAISLHWFIGTDDELTAIVESTDRTSRSKNDNIFDLVFGMYDQKRHLIVENYILTICKPGASFIFKAHAYMANLFATRLNASVMISERIMCKNMKRTIRETVQYMPQRFYKEITIDYLPMDMKNL